MEKLKLQTRDLSLINISKLSKIFPSCITESVDSTGVPKLAVDFDRLRQELSGEVIESGRERYHLQWPGKGKALVDSSSPTTKTLRPVRKDSTAFESTRNIYIEGDNLEALKLLQETYLSKVKMIYIDPPYNTGSDFVYDDDFSEGDETYAKRSLQKDESGGRLVANPESNGRFHSDWLSMMYPRLKLARNLLSDDGVIFISIDDNEVHNLRKICDEIFGDINFYCSFVWQRRSGAMDSVDNTSTDHEYVLCYAKQKQKLNGIQRTFERYENPDNDPRGPWIADNLSAGKAGGDVHYEITDPATGNTFLPPSGRYWPYNRNTMKQKIAEGRILFPSSPGGRPLLKRFQNEAKSEVVPVSTWMKQESDKKVSNSLLSAMNTRGTKEVQELLGGKYFSHPKSTVLIKSLASQCLTKDDDIVLDFFSGSATTAHAIMSRNAEMGTRCRFILVQLDEACEKDTEAFKAGYRTIPEIGRERIRRAGRRLAEANSILAASLDLGFRALRVDSSNMKDVYYKPDALVKEDLFEHIENIKEDRTSEDLLFQVLLDWGVDLGLPIAQENIEDKSVFFVDQNALAACFEKGITEELVKKLAARKPLRVVFRDAGFKSDNVKINVEQIFKLLSPGTEIKTI